MDAIVRFGVVLPAANTTVETEFSAALRGRATVHFQRFTSLAPTPEHAGTSAAGALEAARVLRGARVSALAVAYATGSYFGPREYDDELPRRIADACGAPATTAGLAMVDALRALGATRVAVVSPYSALVNEHCGAYLAAHGLEPIVVAGAVPPGPAGEVPVDDVRRMVRELPKARAEAVLISCTGLRTLSLIGELEAEIGMPVVSSNQATLWRLLQLGKLPAALPSLGRLLDDALETSR